MPGTYHIPTDYEAVSLRGYGLGRSVNHDPRSRRFAYPTPQATELRPVFHARAVPIFDQGNLGSCTGNAALGILGTEPYHSALIAGNLLDLIGPFDENTAVDLYTQITAADPYPGGWPPDDTGSDGLSAAKTLTARGIIPGYRHTFGPDAALAALMDVPLLVGTVWTDAMFTPNRQGLVRPGSLDYPVGGHEWIVDQYDPANGWVGGTSSWGAAFGKSGRFYLTVADFGRLLAADGDVIVLELPGAAAPTPDPAVPVPAPANPAPPIDPADAALADAFRSWRTAKGLPG